MATNLAQAFFTGNLVADMELKYTSQGTAVGNFAIAVNQWRGPEKGEVASFFDFTLWGKQAEGLEPYLKKGKQVAVIAEPEQQRWTNNEGQNRSKVQFTVRSLQLAGGRSDNGNSFQDDPLDPPDDTFKKPSQNEEYDPEKLLDMV